MSPPKIVISSNYLGPFCTVLTALAGSSLSSALASDAMKVIDSAAVIASVAVTEIIMAPCFC